MADNNLALKLWPGFVRGLVFICSLYMTPFILLCASEKWRRIHKRLEEKVSSRHWQADGEGRVSELVTWLRVVLHSHWFLFLQLYCIAAANLLLDS